MRGWRVTCILVGLAASVRAGPVSEAGRAVLADYGDAVVPITAVIRVELPGSGRDPQERGLTLFGTLVGPNGLTAVSATALSPLTGLAEMAGAGARVQPVSSVSQIQLRMPDGSQVSARQLVTDEELDLTLLLPTPGERSPAFPTPVTFSPGVEARVLDDLLILAGTAALLDWTPVIVRAQVNGVVVNPRRMYLVSHGVQQAIGTPAFLADGRPLGLFVVRRGPAATTGRPGAIQVQQTTVILPADDVAEMVERAQRSVEAAPENP